MKKENVQLSVSDNFKNEFVKLNSEYQNYIKMASAKSDEIYKKLEEYYTDDKIKTFKNWEDFLEDINYMLKTHSSAKLIFVKEIQERYF